MSYEKKIHTFVVPIVDGNEKAAVATLLKEAAPIVGAWNLKANKGEIVANKNARDFLPPEMEGQMTEEEAVQYCQRMRIPLTGGVPSEIKQGEYTLGNAFLRFEEEAKKGKKSLEGFALNLAKECQEKEGPTTVKIDRLDDKTYHFIRVDLNGGYSLAVRYNNQRVTCKAYYLKTPDESGFQGKPGNKPAWLKEGQGCAECPVNPKSDAEGRCQHAPQSVCVIIGKYNGVPCAIGPVIWELRGVWGASIYRGTYGKKNTYQKPIRIGEITYEKEGNNNCRKISDVSKDEPIWFEQNSDIFKHIRSIDAGFKTLAILKTSGPYNPFFKVSSPTPPPVEIPQTEEAPDDDAFTGELN